MPEHDAVERLARWMHSDSDFSAIASWEETSDYRRTHYRRKAQRVLDVLGLEQVGWRIGNSIGQAGSWYGNHGEPVYRLRGTDA